MRTSFIHSFIFKCQQLTFNQIYNLVLAIIPVAKEVFKTQLKESISLSSITKSKPPPPILPTRAGPPPSPAPNSKPLPRNVIIRMGLWSCLLILSNIPVATVVIFYYVEYINRNDERQYEKTHWPASDHFLARNGSVIHMCLNMGLFLLCFGTGESANEQYQKLWTKIFGFIFCR